MPLSDPDLWKLIETWPLPYRSERDDADPPKRLCTRFEHNLRKIGDWTDEATEEITAAYRRFLYLKTVSGETLTPPVWIDEAWHLHLGFLRDYAALEAAAGRPIPHRQDLSAVERTVAFDRGRKLWIEEFGEFPDKRIWPTPQAIRNELRWRVIMFVGIGMFLIALLMIAAQGLFLNVEPVPRTFLIGIMTAMICGLPIFVIAGEMSNRLSPETISRCG